MKYNRFGYLIGEGFSNVEATLLLLVILYTLGNCEISFWISSLFDKSVNLTMYDVG